MSRRVVYYGYSSGPLWLPETTAYMTAVGIPADGTATVYGITGLEVWQLVDVYISSGMAKGWWTIQDVLWAYIGGNATAHRYNMKDPSLFPLTFNGAITHNANGVTPNGVNGWAETGWNMATDSVNYTQNSASMGFYCRTTETGLYTDMGTQNGTQANGAWLLNGRGIAQDRIDMNASGLVGTIAAIANAQGLISVDRPTSARQNRYRNGALLDGENEASSVLLSDTLALMTYKLGGSNLFYSPRNYAMHYAGASMTTTQHADFYADTQALMTGLGRQV